MVQMGLRLGARPRVLVTTTPRPIPLVRSLMVASSTALVRGSTDENADNLAPSFLTAIRERYEGTRLGRQELMAELLDDVVGALWARDQLDVGRVREAPAMVRKVVAVDPAGGHRKTSDEHGIVVAGQGWCQCKAGKRELHGFALSDLSGRFSPDEAAQRVIATYRRERADAVIVETNFGGDMFGALLRTVDPGVNVISVTASRGKVLRAEPVAALYEQGRVHHVGALPELEDQLCSYSPAESDGSSPDRLDALVWAFTELMVDSPGASLFAAMAAARERGMAR
jgi:phage terminase large subunit-like protein